MARRSRGGELFPRPAHRTGRADFPHPALGSRLVGRVRSRANVSVAKIHKTQNLMQMFVQEVERVLGQFRESRFRLVHRQLQSLHELPHRLHRLFGGATAADHEVVRIVHELSTQALRMAQAFRPIFHCGSSLGRALPLKLRLLRSTRVTGLPRYYEPLRPSSQPGLSLAGARLTTQRHWEEPFTLPLGFVCQHAVAITSVRLPTGRNDPVAGQDSNLQNPKHLT